MLRWCKNRIERALHRHQSMCRLFMSTKKHLGQRISHSRTKIFFDPSITVIAHYGDNDIHRQLIEQWVLSTHMPLHLLSNHRLMSRQIYSHHFDALCHHKKGEISITTTTKALVLLTVSQRSSMNSHVHVSRSAIFFFSSLSLPLSRALRSRWKIEERTSEINFNHSAVASKNNITRWTFFSPLSIFYSRDGISAALIHTLLDQPGVSR